MVGLDARATMDLDATIKGTNVSVEDVEMIISKIISIPPERWRFVLDQTDIGNHGRSRLSGCSCKHGNKIRWCNHPIKD